MTYCAIPLPEDPMSKQIAPHPKHRHHRRAARPVATLAAAALTLFSLGGTAEAASGDNRFLISRMEVAAPAGARNLCKQYTWACARSGGGAAMSPHQVNLAIQVNTQINRTTREISDISQYGKEEVWALPTRRGGDCEDFALLKKRELMKLGVASEHLLIATVLDRNRVSHAVLVIRTERGDFILDNLTSKVMTWEQTGYTFLRMQDPTDPGKWTAVIAGGIINSPAASLPVSSISSQLID